MMTMEKPCRSIHTGLTIPKPPRTFKATAKTALTRSVSGLPFRQQPKPALARKAAPAKAAKPLTRQQVEDAYSRITDPRARARYRAMYGRELGINRKGK